MRLRNNWFSFYNWNFCLPGAALNELTSTNQITDILHFPIRIEHDACNMANRLRRRGGITELKNNKDRDKCLD